MKNWRDGVGMAGRRVRHAVRPMARRSRLLSAASDSRRVTTEEMKWSKMASAGFAICQGIYVFLGVVQKSEALAFFRKAIDNHGGQIISRRGDGKNNPGIFRQFKGRQRFENPVFVLRWNEGGHFLSPSAHYSMIWLTLLILGTIFLARTPAHALTIPDLLQKVKENQSNIQTLQADTETTMESSNKNMPAMKQTGRLYQKYPGKSRTEVDAPTKQITIMNGSKMKFIDGATGKSFTKDMSELGAIGGSPSGSIAQMTNLFDLKILSENESEILLEGRPKTTNNFMEKIEFTLSAETFLPQKIDSFAKGGRKLSVMNIAYKEIDKVQVPVETRSTIYMPNGQMNALLQYKNVKVNQPIKESMFDVE